MLSNAVIEGFRASPRVARGFSQVCLLLALLAVGAAPAPAQTGPPAPRGGGGEGWKELVSPEGRFSVLMIGTAKQTQQELDTAIGKVVMNNFMSVTGAGGFGVTYTDFPQYSETPEFAAAVLNGARDNVLAKDKSKRLLSEREIKVEGYAGREWLVSDGAGMLYRARTFMAGGRLYQVLLLTSVSASFNRGQASPRPEDRAADYEAMSEKFFGSFKLLRERPAAGGGKND